MKTTTPAGDPFAIKTSSQSIFAKDKYITK